MTRKVDVKTRNVRLPDHIFRLCEKALVFSSVDVIIESHNSFLLGIRKIQPVRGTWGLPGGIIRRGELRDQAVRRIAKLETGLDVQIARFLGAYDHVWHTRQYVSNCYIAQIKDGILNSNLPSGLREFSKLRFFRTIPPNTHRNYATLLKDAGWKRVSRG